MIDAHDNRPPPAMNRAARRVNRRRLLAALRDSGCTCKPRVIPDDTPVANRAESGWVSHQEGCPLDQRLSLARLAGREPELVVNAVGRCKR